MSAQQTTVAVIGGGPGGYVAAIRAAQLGAKVCLIEKETLGGTCLNVGCIPTKSLLHTAQKYTDAKESSYCGVSAQVELDFTKSQQHKNAIVQQLVGGVKGLLAANKVELIQATATFASSDSLTIHTGSQQQTRQFDKIIIATGSVPIMPPLPGIDAPQCIDSTEALSLPQVPSSLLVIGGGVIGIELATLYHLLGAKVTVVEMLDDILPMMDSSLTSILRADLQKRGIAFSLRSTVLSITDNGSDAKVRVALESGDTKEFSAEKILIAIGRRANINSLQLEKAGLAHEKRGITVNERMETNVPGIYAIGDCLGKHMLAHIASIQGEVAAENCMGKSARFSAQAIPSCIYTNPEFAGVGLTEEQAKQQNIPYLVGTFPFMANGKALIMNGGKGMVKIIVGKEYKEILGVHILGARATDLIAEGALAIMNEVTVDELIATIHAHPTMTEAVREAALAIQGQAIHIPNK